MSWDARIVSITDSQGLLKSPGDYVASTPLGTFGEIVALITSLYGEIPNLSRNEVRVRTGGDGSMLMNLGCLVTAAQHAVPLYVVLIDNGRSEILASEDYRETIRCIRCGAFV